jgi:hypothetical protein
VKTNGARPDYGAFLQRKAQAGAAAGFSPEWVPDFLFDFQAAITTWAIQGGRRALFADCGMGKTPMQLVWAENIVRRTNGRVLILTPLAVSAQTLAEAEKFGVEAKRSREGETPARIVVTNYERLHYFDPSDFDGVVCDESSILKSFNGATRSAITAFMRKVPYRLLCTATAAPNDYTELGTSSEAIGYLGYMDMLGRFFKNEQNNASQGRHYGKAVKWRFKGYAEEPFWRWVCSWARAVRRPSDLGFEDRGFRLPDLTQAEHVVECRTLPEGMLFPLPAVTLPEQREERRRTIAERCEKVAELVDHGDHAIAWCQLNAEGDLLTNLIDGAVQVSGSDADEEKEEKLLAFQRGEARVLVTKPTIGAWGLNFQHCAHTTFFPSHSYEQYYQAVRRCWRFGQTRPVHVDIVTTEGAAGVLANLQRKAEAADEMFTRLVAHMNEAIRIDRAADHTGTPEIPSWL